MLGPGPVGEEGSGRMSVLRQHLPLVTTAVIFVALFGVASFLYNGFCSGPVAVNLLGDNAVLGIAALGLTLVIFTGGIDLSVGAVAGFTSIFVATLISGHGWSPGAAWGLALLLGTGFGAAMGGLVQACRLPAFLVTLAGMFFARGMAYQVSTESVSIDHPLYTRLTEIYLPLGVAELPFGAMLLLVALAATWVAGHHTRSGRNLLAIGGNEQSAVLMGLPVGRTKVLAYAASGGCAALAGILFTITTGSGDSARGVGMELDAIAVVVIGGTLLAGGRGHVAGTLLGLLIFAVIQAALLFDGRLSSWWSRIVVGVLLLAFILLQRFLPSRKRTV